MIEAIQDGLPLVSRPYAAVAADLGVDEDTVLSRIASLLGDGRIKRFGVVVSHRALGYRANAMVVWDVPDDEIGDVGRRLGRWSSVTLCYRRPRRLPDWPFNLFCMVHGQDRRTVREQLTEAVRALDLSAFPYRILFSRRCFKQRGARYVPAPGVASTSSHG